MRRGRTRGKIRIVIITICAAAQTANDRCRIARCGSRSAAFVIISRTIADQVDDTGCVRRTTGCTSPVAGQTARGIDQYDFAAGSADIGRAGRVGGRQSTSDCAART